MTAPDTNRQLVAEIRSAYEGSAESWADGPAALYRRLADALVEAAPGSLAGQSVLDLGAGTGVASEALVASGARPVGVDLAWAMLAHRHPQRPPGVVGDAAKLPIRADTFDAVVAAFSLNHVPDLPGALGECRRVTRSGGSILASTFPSDDEHPAKRITEAVLEGFGYQRPSWYETFKAHIAGLTGDSVAFAQAATTAGLNDAQVTRLDVDVGLDDPRVAAAWRLNMPHTIEFVAALDPARRATLRTRLIAALPAGLPRSIPILALRARAA